jgi:hypothetical protein
VWACVAPPDSRVDVMFRQGNCSFLFICLCVNFWSPCTKAKESQILIFCDLYPRQFASFHSEFVPYTTEQESPDFAASLHNSSKPWQLEDGALACSLKLSP